MLIYICVCVYVYTYDTLSICYEFMFELRESVCVS